jgi:membrane associated rhomboid family serine protease
MIVPLGTDRDGRRPAHAVRLLIALNAFVAWAMYTGGARWICTPGELQAANERAQFLSDGNTTGQFAERLAFTAKLTLVPGESPWWTWITALFTHDPTSLLHLLGNMLFLWAFGKSIESHLGFWRFLTLYILGGLAGWAGHWMVDGGAVIGASGATASVACLFVAFFPRSQSRIFVMLGMMVMMVPSAWLIGAFFAIDLLQLLFSRTGAVSTDVAVGAHLGGSLFGLGAGLLLLRLGWAPRGEWDMLYLLRQSWRRRALRAAMREGTMVIGNKGPIVTPSTQPPPRPTPFAAATAAPVSSEASATRSAHRNKVLEALKREDPDAVCAALRTMLATSPHESLPPDAQLSAGNFALQRGEAALAAHAYANFLALFPADSKATEVRLLLASLYSRRLQRRDEARALLTGILDRLRDPDQRSLAESLIAECAAPQAPASLRKNAAP